MASIRIPLRQKRGTLNIAAITGKLRTDVVKFGVEAADPHDFTRKERA
ncbi:MAG: hypothetical protein N2111_12250 [Candidatus Sumerlaeaceae bacterium]|nr:hypothetical protein [Candidatus Sumerlaeaceae bacterium]